MANHVFRESYTEYRYKKNLQLVQFTFVGFLLLFALTIFQDVSNLESMSLVYPVLRFGIVLPIGFVVYGFTFWQGFWKYYQIAFTTVYLIVMYSIIIFIMIEPTLPFYYFFLVIGFVWGFTLLDLAIPYIVLSNIAVLLVFVAFSFFMIADVFPDIYQYLSFYVILLGILMISKLQTEKQLKYDYDNTLDLEDKSLDLEGEISKAVAQVAHTQLATVEALASLAESKDKTTGDHIGRVGYLCKVLAQKLPVSYFYDASYTQDEFIQTIELASLLHDIGKIGVDPLILNKEGPLSPDEFKQMEKHTTIGHQTLQRILKKFPKNTLISMGADIARHHHENWDGTGYPDKLEKYEIPLSARIVSIIDVYDALMSKRPYKEAFSFEESVSIMEKLKYIKFDPKLLDYFLQVIKQPKVQKDLRRISSLY